MTTGFGRNSVACLSDTVGEAQLIEVRRIERIMVDFNLRRRAVRGGSNRIQAAVLLDFLKVIFFNNVFDNLFFFKKNCFSKLTDYFY
jgi:hypothetical protein